MKLGVLLFWAMVRRHPLRFVLITLCTMFCFTGLLGLRWAEDRIIGSRQRFEADCGIGDIVVYTDDVQQGELKTMLLRIDGIEEADEGTIAQPLRVRCADGTQRSVRFVSLCSEDVVRPIRTGTGAALSYGYATDFDAEAVAALTLEDGQTIAVSELAWMPLFTGVYLDRFVPSTDGDLIDVYVSFEELERLTGQTNVNYGVVSLSAEADASQVLEQIYANPDIFVTYATLSRDESGMAAALELEEMVSQICRLFPWFFWTVGLAFVCVFLTGVAGRSAKSILNLKDQGASSRSIFTGLCLFGSAATLSGLLFAVPTAMLLANFVAKTVLENMAMPYDAVPYDMLGIVLCVAGSVLVCTIAAFVGNGSVVRFRHPRKNTVSSLLLTVISTAAAVGMAACALLFMDSVDAVRQEYFDHRYHYDVQLVYDGFVPLTRLQELRESELTTACEPMLLGSATVINGEIAKDVTCVALSQSPLMIVRDENNRILKPVENAIILSQATANALGVSETDLVQLEVRYGRHKILATCTVADISHQLSSPVEVVSIDTVEAYLNSSGVMNSTAVKVKPGKMAEFLTFAQQQDIYAVQTGEAGRQRFDNRYSGTRALMWVIFFAGAALGLSVCLLMCFVQWKQNLRRNTIMTLLGAHPLRLHGQGLGVRFFGCLLGLCLGLAAATAIMPVVLKHLSTQQTVYPFVCTRKTIAVCCALCFGYELCCQGVYFLANRKQCSRLDSQL